MRLLIYLLAMLTGFSAAEAARPVSATPATLGSAVSSAAIVAASVSIAERHEITRPLRTYEATGAERDGCRLSSAQSQCLRLSDPGHGTRRFAALDSPMRG